MLFHIVWLWPDLSGSNFWCETLIITHLRNFLESGIREFRVKSSQKNFSSALHGKGLSGVMWIPIHPDQTDLSQEDNSSVEFSVNTPVVSFWCCWEGFDWKTDMFTVSNTFTFKFSQILRPNKGLLEEVALWGKKCESLTAELLNPQV